MHMISRGVIAPQGDQGKGDTVKKTVKDMLAASISSGQQENTTPDSSNNTSIIIKCQLQSYNKVNQTIKRKKPYPLEYRDSHYEEHNPNIDETYQTYYMEHPFELTLAVNTKTLKPQTIKKKANSTLQHRI